MKLLLEGNNASQATEAVIDNLRNFREKLHDAVHDNIQQAQTKMKEAHMKKLQSKFRFQPGDAVYRRNCRKLQRKQSKLKELNWTGPFTIQSVSSSGVAVLKDRKGNVLKSKCSIGNLKLQRTRPNYLQCARDPSLNSAKAEASLTTTEQKDVSTEGKRKMPLMPPPRRKLPPQ